MKVSKAFEEAIRETGFELERASHEVALYSIERAAFLSTIAHEAGFGEAVEAEAAGVFAYAARRAVRAADQGDQRALDIIRGFLIGKAGG